MFTPGVYKEFWLASHPGHTELLLFLFLVGVKVTMAKLFCWGYEDCASIIRGVSPRLVLAVIAFDRPATCVAISVPVLYRKIVGYSVFWNGCLTTSFLVAENHGSQLRLSKE